MRIYVHIPFCLHKCHYCDFNSHVFAQPPWQVYAEALVREIETYAKQSQFAARPVASIFFGGGTPSLAPASLFSDVIQTIRKHFLLDQHAEITIEANPGASEMERFQAYRQAGINRLSIGVQSFDQAELQWLERIHSADEAKQAFTWARRAGFENINLDLMYALPQQSLSEWFVSLETALALQPEHLSCYQLTVEPNTQLHLTHKKKALALPDEDMALDFFTQTRQRLADAGYAAYEISNFSLPGQHCQHNCGYWQYDDYLGIGAGAAGKWDEADGRVLRYSNIRAPQAYLHAIQDQGIAVQSNERLSSAVAMGEAIWLGLRQLQGVDTVWFERRFDVSIVDVYANLLEKWQTLGYLEQTSSHLRLTHEGRNLADDIAASFLW